MSTVVHHGLNSRLESQMMEYRTLKLKLSSPKLSFSQSLEIALQSCVIVPADSDAKKLDIPVNPVSEELCLETTSNTLHSEKSIGLYVHPSTKYTSTWLSEKSLNLCTENLGSETGSELVENSIFSSQACSSSTVEIKNSMKKIQLLPMRNLQVHATKNKKKKQQYPPPLTTLCGSDSLHVKPHREDGKLILKATRSNPTARSCFLVDRSNGRLRLSLIDSTGRGLTDKITGQDEDDK